MIKINQQEKALYRVGQKVTCDHYPTVVFKVTAKEWDSNGTVLYAISCPAGNKFIKHCGLRQKYLNKA